MRDRILWFVFPKVSTALHIERHIRSFAPYDVLDSLAVRVPS